MKREHCLTVLKNMLVIHKEKEPWERYGSGKTYFWSLDPRDFMTDALVFYQEKGFTTHIPYDSIRSLAFNPFGDLVISMNDGRGDTIVQHESLELKPKDKVHLPAKPFYEFRRLCIKEGFLISKTATRWFFNEKDGLEMMVKSKPDGRKYKVLLAKYGGARQAGLLSVKVLYCFGDWQTVLSYATAEEALEYIKKEGNV